jgi:hypothetical protein
MIPFNFIFTDKVYTWKCSKKLVSLILSAGVAGLASAHPIPSASVSELLEPANTAYDIYRTTCYSDTVLVDPESNSAGAATGLRAGVSMTARGAAGVTAKVTIGAARSGVTSQASCTDITVTAGGYTYPTNYCGGTDGTQAYLGKGNGDYTLVVSHGSTITGTLSYNMFADCVNTALPLGARLTGIGAHLTYSAGATIVKGIVTGTVNILPETYIKQINQ